MANIRPAQPKDAKAIARVYVETWRNTYAGLLPDSILVKMSLERQRASWSRTLVAGNQIVVLEHDGGVVGFGSCGRNKLRRLDYTGEIYTLYVLPDFHGRGLGRKLIVALFDALIGGDHDSALLWVLVTNPSRFFYEAMGGRRIAERDENIFGHRLHEVAYGWRPLAPLFSPE